MEIGIETTRPREVQWSIRNGIGNANMTMTCSVERGQVQGVGTVQRQNPVRCQGNMVIARTVLEEQSESSHGILLGVLRLHRRGIAMAIGGIEAGTVHRTKMWAHGDAPTIVDDEFLLLLHPVIMPGGAHTKRIAQRCSCRRFRAGLILSTLPNSSGSSTGI